VKVEKLTLRNFRNIADCTFEPSPHLNFLIGANGQGKTSFLEALSYIATLRSFRGAKNDEVIRWGQDSAEVSCTISDEANPSPDVWRTELKVTFSRPQIMEGLVDRNGRATKVAFINGKPFRSSTQYLSQRFGSFELGFHTVVFNPADHDLVRGEPAIRRAYLDRVLAAEDVEYLKAIQKYQRTLEQRNALLKGDVPPSREMLAGFTEPLSRYGAIITFKRLEWLMRVAPRLDSVARQIAPNQPSLTAFYVSNWVPEIKDLSINNNKLNSGHFAGLPHPVSIELLEQAFWKQLSTLEQAELRSRSSLVGPHRDDWSFYLGEQVLKGHGSQGEVRSALLALKLSEIDLFRERTGHRPLLLLDDFSSELDQERRGFLLRYLMDTDLQVFVSTTEDKSTLGRRFWVTHGSLSPELRAQDSVEAGMPADRTAEPGEMKPYDHRTD
jgi:DNA replication and repair protein RecF